MKAPSYKRRQLLEEILDDGVKLFSMLSQSEEELRRELVSGDHAAFSAAEKNRLLLLEKIGRLEERRKKLIPEGTGLKKYIKSTANKSHQAFLLTKLDKIIEELQKSRVLNEVNRHLLQERWRFFKDLPGPAEETKLTYDRQGKLKKGAERPIKNLDRSV